VSNWTTGRDGPLPPLLLVLTFVTGLVDAASYLKLGHVFVANMTGNVVFLGFALAGAAGLSLWASLAAMKLLGDANWYLPRWLEWLPEVRHELAPHAEPALEL
jgi:Predicted membrane protein